MSTVDGFTFIGGVNFGRDLIWRWRREPDESRVNRYVQIGFVVTAMLALTLALFFRSAVDLWHDVGSVGVPALLIPLLSSYSDRWRMSPRAAVLAIVAGGGVSLTWLLWRNLGDAAYPLGLEPIYPGLAVSALIWSSRFLAGGRNLPSRPVI
jgi:hypothetical protein